jgi:hypothetical protein
MLDYLPLSIALIGSSIAAAWDLKTTEIPDIIPHVMILSAIVFWGIQSYILNDYWLIAQSFLVGIGLLGFGFLMYYLGQWGGGDAKMLSAIGFLVPQNIYSFKIQAIHQNILNLLPFPIIYLINVFFLGAIYMIIYAIVLSFINRKIIQDFLFNIKSSIKSTITFFVSIFIFSLILNSIISYNLGIFKSISTSITVASLSLALILLWKFIISVEKVGFRKKVHVNKLKVGDVLQESRFWEGITEKDIERIKKSGKKYVIIKDGVRFAPVFPITLLFTLFIGDFTFLFFSFV